MTGRNNLYTRFICLCDFYEFIRNCFYGLVHGWLHFVRMAVKERVNGSKREPTRDMEDDQARTRTKFLITSCNAT